MIIATVAEPWAVRTRAVIRKQTGNARVALPCRVPIALAMSVCFKTPPKAAPAAVIRTMTAPDERASDETLRNLSLSPEHRLAKMMNATTAAIPSARFFYPRTFKNSQLSGLKIACNVPPATRRTGKSTGKKDTMAEGKLSSSIDTPATIGGGLRSNLPDAQRA